MKHAQRRVLITLVFFLSSCNVFNTNRHLTGRYYLSNDEFGKSICYKVDNDIYLDLIIGEFGRIGCDDNFIIVQRAENEYLIVKVYKEMNYSPQDGISGPYNLSEFN